MDFFTALFTTPVARLNPWHRTTFSMTPHERRLEKYRRYRISLKGWERTQRYNASPAHMAACRRYIEWHPRTPASYQNGRGRWMNLVKVDPRERQA